MSEMNVHIGQMIAAVARKKRLTTVEIQDALCSGSRNISYVFNRADISVLKLYRISDRMNYNFFADLHPIVVQADIPLEWIDIEKLFKTERLHTISIKIEFPVSRAGDLGKFLMLLNALGLKMGFKLG